MLSGRAFLALLPPLALAACGTSSRLDPGPAAVIECAPYARQLSGLQLYGDAAAWWDQAAGRYQRSSTPRPGSVLVFRATRRLPWGHVSVVAGLRSEREILVDQANWVHSHIGRHDPVVDVSRDNDWTAVRVWWAPAGQLGATVYPTYGFVGPGPASDASSSITPEPRSECIADAQPSD
jgi:surface antigen